MTVEFKNLNIDSKAWVFQSTTLKAEQKVKVLDIAEIVEQASTD